MATEQTAYDAIYAAAADAFRKIGVTSEPIQAAADAFFKRNGADIRFAIETLFREEVKSFLDLNQTAIIEAIAADNLGAIKIFDVANPRDTK